MDCTRLRFNILFFLEIQTPEESDENIGCSVNSVARNLIMKGGEKEFVEKNRCNVCHYGCMCISDTSDCVIVLKRIQGVLQ